MLVGWLLPLDQELGSISAALLGPCVSVVSTGSLPVTAANNQP